MGISLSRAGADLQCPQSINYRGSARVAAVAAATVRACSVLVVFAVAMIVWVGGSRAQDLPAATAPLGRASEQQFAPNPEASATAPSAIANAKAIDGKVAVSANETAARVLPADLSPLGMFLAADIVVKAVMVGLALASFLVWTIWIAKWAQLWRGRRVLKRDFAAIAGMTSVEAASSTIADRRSLARGMLDVARSEMGCSHTYPLASAQERVHSRLSELELQLVRDIRGGMSFLATVGSTAPFVGLFGTVWGIMNSFIGISKSQTTNLAVVAPGIAEALLATAIGLVAAIPAVILYNNLGKGIATFRGLARETRGEVERIVSRQMAVRIPTRTFPSLTSAAE